MELAEYFKVSLDNMKQTLIRCITDHVSERGIYDAAVIFLDESEQSESNACIVSINSTTVTVSAGHPNEDDEDEVYYENLSVELLIKILQTLREE